MSQALPPPEFSRPILMAQLGDRPLARTLEATAKERAALARRFGLVSLDNLTAEVELTRDRQRVELTGQLRAKLTQSCVVTGEPVRATIDEALRLIFLPEPRQGADEEEVELSEEDLDTLMHDGRAVDVGESLAQSLALSLDPFPRAKNADKAARQAGIKNEEEAGAFGALADLKAQMEKRDE